MSCPVRSNLFKGSVLILSFSALCHMTWYHTSAGELSLSVVLYWGFFFKMPSKACYNETPQQVLTHSHTDESLTVMNWTRRHVSFFLLYIHWCHRRQRLGQRNGWLLAAKFCWPTPTCTVAFFIILCQFSLYTYDQSITLSCIGSSPAKSEQGNRPTSAEFSGSRVLLSNVIYSVFGLMPTAEVMGPMCTWMACLHICSGLTRSLLG